jgi:hypothetical protein
MRGPFRELNHKATLMPSHSITSSAPASRICELVIKPAKTLGLTVPQFAPMGSSPSPNWAAINLRLDLNQSTFPGTRLI